MAGRQPHIHAVCVLFTRAFSVAGMGQLGRKGMDLGERMAEDRCMLKVLLPTLMIGASLLLAPSAQACSCAAMDEGAPIELSEADVVFEGSVVEIEDAGGHLLVSFAVARSFQGAEAAETLQLRTGLNSAGCGYPFELDETYLVFAYRSDDGATPGVSLCGRTREISLAASTLAALEPAFGQSVHALEDLQAAPRPPKAGKGKVKGCGVAPGNAGDASCVVMFGLLGVAFARARRRS